MSMRLRHLGLAVASVGAGFFVGASWAGEILVGPKGQERPEAGSASEQRQKAREYRTDAPASGGTIILVPEEEAGVLAPRSGADGASDNRTRARAYRQSPTNEHVPPIPVPRTESQPAPDSTQAHARDNRLRAKSYRQSSVGTTSFTGRIGADGLPLVACRDVDNVAGRIGDDVQSGALVIVMRNGKPVKARCQ